MAEHERLDRIYTVAFHTMVERSGTTVTAEFVRLKAASDEGRIDADVARLELENHRRRHAKAN
jgi:hypothetical protein